MKKKENEQNQRNEDGEHSQRGQQSQTKEKMVSRRRRKRHSLSSNAIKKSIKNPTKKLFESLLHGLYSVQSLSVFSDFLFLSIESTHSTNHILIFLYFDLLPYFDTVDSDWLNLHNSIRIRIMLRSAFMNHVTLRAVWIDPYKNDNL